MNFDINHIARLARIKLGESDIEPYERDMAEMLLMVEELPEITEELLPDEANAMTLREDIAIDSEITREELLANAPEVKKSCLAFPKTVG